MYLRNFVIKKFNSGKWVVYESSVNGTEVKVDCPTIITAIFENSVKCGLVVKARMYCGTLMDNIPIKYKINNGNWLNGRTPFLIRGLKKDDKVTLKFGGSFPFEWRAIVFYEKDVLGWSWSNVGFPEVKDKVYSFKVAWNGSRTLYLVFSQRGISGGKYRVIVYVRNYTDGAPIQGATVVVKSPYADSDKSDSDADPYKFITNSEGKVVFHCGNVPITVKAYKKGYKLTNDPNKPSSWSGTIAGNTVIVLYLKKSGSNVSQPSPNVKYFKLWCYFDVVSVPKKLYVSNIAVNWVFVNWTKGSGLVVLDSNVSRIRFSVTKCSMKFWDSWAYLGYERVGIWEYECLVNSCFVKIRGVSGNLTSSDTFYLNVNGSYKAKVHLNVVIDGVGVVNVDPPNENINSSCTFTYDCGKWVYLSVVQGEFKGWYIDGKLISNKKSIKLLLLSDLTIIARFCKTMPSFNITANAYYVWYNDTSTIHDYEHPNKFLPEDCFVILANLKFSEEHLVKIRVGECKYIARHCNDSVELYCKEGSVMFSYFEVKYTKEIKESLRKHGVFRFSIPLLIIIDDKYAARYLINITIVRGVLRLLYYMLSPYEVKVGVQLLFSDNYDVATGRLRLYRVNNVLVGDLRFSCSDVSKAIVYRYFKVSYFSNFEEVIVKDALGKDYILPLRVKVYKLAPEVVYRDNERFDVKPFIISKGYTHGRLWVYVYDIDKTSGVNKALTDLKTFEGFLIRVWYSELKMPMYYRVVLIVTKNGVNEIYIPVKVYLIQYL